MGRGHSYYHIKLHGDFWERNHSKPYPWPLDFTKERARGGKVANWDYHCHGPSETASDPRPLSPSCLPETQIFVCDSRLTKAQSYAARQKNSCSHLWVLHGDTCFWTMSLPTHIVLSLGVSLLYSLPQRTKVLVFLSCTLALFIKGYTQERKLSDVHPVL